MIITISNEIRVEKPPKELIQHIQQSLVLDNPEYQRRQKMGRWLGNTPAQLYLYRIDGDTLCIPVGAGYLLQPYVKGGAAVRHDLAPWANLQYDGTVDLYEYQQKAVAAAVKAGRGVLQSPCGSGKTQMGIALAAALRGRTLWLTHTNDLLEQSYERARKYFPEKCMGKIAAGKVHVGTHFTFATVQTLSRLDLTQYKYTWDTVIVDECHRVAGTPASSMMFYKVLNALAAGRKYGLTATAHRADGLIKTTFAMLGPVIYTVPDEAVKEKTMQVVVQRVDTPVGLSEDVLDTDGTIIYSRLIDLLAGHPERNRLIGGMLKADNGHYCLILSDRLEHLERLMRFVDPQEAALISGKTPRRERTAAIEDLRTGRKHYLFATYRLAKEGLDIPRLDRLYMAMPQKDYAIVTQSVGRIARVAEGKEQPICYDFVDQIGYCERAFKKRKTSYRKAGCQIWEQ